MHASHFLSLLSLTASALAITVTSPNEGATWASSGPKTVTWARVSTDPTTFAVTLVQQGVYKQTLADNVDGAKGSLVVVATLPTGSAFQVNLVKSSQDLNGILAQSAQFNITQSANASSTPGTSSSTGTGNAMTTVSTGTSASAGTDSPNASEAASNSSAPAKSNAAFSSIHYPWAGLMGILAFSVGLVFV